MEDDFQINEYETLANEPLFQAEPPVTTNPSIPTVGITNSLRGLSAGQGLDPMKYGKVNFMGIADKRNQRASLQGRGVGKEAYTELSDGTLVPKLEVYNPAISVQTQEELLASAQGGGNMFSRAMARLGGQTAINVAGGTVGTVNGIIQAIRMGSMEAFYNNDFSNYLEDLRKKNDANNRIYTPAGYNDLNFGQKMLTGKFYADELTGGISFLAGTILSEGIWAAATGGVGVAAKGMLGAGGRLAQKAMLGKNLRGVVDKSIKDGKTLLASSWKGQVGKEAMEQGTKQIVDATINAANLQKAFNHMRFTLTSAGYESSVEALGYLEEVENEFINRTMNEKGRLPTAKEIGEVRNAAISGANGVFGANLALVGFSNYTVLGKMLLGRNTTKQLNNSWFKNKIMGLGTVKNADGSLAAIQANKWQKAFRTAYGFGKPMFVEGVVEEGGQATISKSISDYVLSGYDADTTNDNLSLVDAILTGLEETYTTKEGLTEVGLGALIGILGGGMSTSFRFNEAAREHKATEETVKYVNSLTGDRLIKHMMASNKMTSAVKRADSARKKGNLTEEMNADTAAMTALVERGLVYQNTKEIIADFNAQLDHADNQQLAEQMDMSVKEVKTWKRIKAAEFAEVAEKHARHIQFAEALLGNTNIAGLEGLEGYEQVNKKLALQNAIAFAMTMGPRAEEYAQSLAHQMKQVTVKDLSGKSTSAIEVNEALRKVTQSKKISFGKLTANKNKLEQQIARLSNQIQKAQTVADVQEPGAAAKRQASLQNMTAKLEELTARLAEVENQREVAVQSMNVETTAGIPLTVEQLDNQTENVKHLEATLNEYMLTDPELNDALKQLTTEYSRAVSNAKAFDSAIKMIMDPTTRVNMLNGWLSNIINKNKALNQETGQYFIELLQAYGKTSIRTLSGANQADRTQTDQPEEQPPKNNDPINEDPTQQPPENPVAEMNNAPDSMVSPQAQAKPVIEQIRGRVKEAVEGDIYANTRYEGVENNLEEVIPTQEDINRYNELLDKAEEVSDTALLETDPGQAREEMQLEEEDFNEFVELNSKLNRWQTLSGMQDNESSLAELLTLAQQIQDGIEADATVTNISARNYYVATESDQTEPKGDNKGLGFIINPDNVTAKKVKDGTYEITHLKPTSLTNLFPNTSFYVVIDGRFVLAETVPLDKMDELRRTPGTIFQLRAGANRIDFEMTDRQRLKVDREQFESLVGPGSRVRILDYGVSNFNPLYVQNEDGSYSPLDGDFLIETTTENEVVTLDKDALYGMEPGTPLRTIVNKNDKHNAMLFKQFEAGQITEEELANEMVIYLAKEGSPNNIVGVVRAIKPTTHGNAGSYGLVSLLRRTALKKVQKATLDKVEIGITIPLQNVLTGNPNINTVEENGRLVPQNMNFTAEALNQILDYGFIQDETVQTQNNLDLTPKELLFARKAAKQTANQGKKVPFVVFEFKGERFAFPVALKEGAPRGIEDLQAMLADETLSEAQKIFKLNQAAKGVGLDFRQYQIADLVSPQSIEEAARMLQDIGTRPTLPNVEEWTNEGFDKAALADQAMIGIDITNRPLLAPKGSLSLKDMGIPTEQDQLTEQVNLLSDLAVSVERRFRETEPFSEMVNPNQFFEAFYENDAVETDPDVLSKNYLQRAKNKNILVDAFTKSIPKSVRTALGDDMVKRIQNEVKMLRMMENGINPNQKFQEEVQSEINKLKTECE